MKNNITSPHDRYFRSIMSDPKVAREFFEHHLPSNIKKVIDCSTIRPQKDSFIQDNLKQQIADLLFSADFNGEKGYIYLLLEHQSTPDKFMPFRILKYVIAIMEEYLKKTGKKRLPIVYPMIFYSGNQPYKYSTDIFDLFEGDRELAKDILWQPYQLIDLSKMLDKNLKKDILYSFFMRTMHYAHEKNIKILTDYLKELIKNLDRIESIGSVEYFHVTIEYIFRTFNISKEGFSRIIKDNLQLVGEEENMATLAEQFRQEGYEKGRALAEQLKQEGMQKGMQKGMIEGMQEGVKKERKTVAIRLFSKGMTIAEIAAITNLSVSEIETLRNNSSN